MGDVWRQHRHPPVYALETASDGGRKVLATACGCDPVMFPTLVGRLTPPSIPLYALHTRRGESETGRYEGPEMSGAECAAFVERFHDFLTVDGRFHLWLHAPTDGATLVWDRHDLIHADGSSEHIIQALAGLGLHLGHPAIPLPHEHHHHAGGDADAAALLTNQPWRYSPLLEGDER